MTTGDRGKAVHLLFDIGVIAKAVNGLLELAGGIALLLVSPAQINGLLRVVTRRELSRDPHDAVAGWLLHSAQHLSIGTETFAAFFLLWHGVVKVGLAVALLRKLRWAYPTAMAAFALFLAYQFYRYGQTHSAWLLAISVLDVVVIILTWLEYQRLGRLGEFRLAAPR